MRPLKGTFLGLLAIFIAWSASQFLAGGLFEVYFFNLGVPIEEIYLANALWFVAGIILVPIARKMDAKKFMIAASFISILCINILIFPMDYAAIWFRLLYGLQLVLFWVPFNILYYEHVHKNNAVMGSLYCSIGPFVSLVLPAVSGTVAEFLGFESLFVLAMGSYAITMVLTWFFASERKFDYTMKNAMKAVSGLKWIIFIEGFAITSMMSITMPIMVLSYISQPIEVGWFLSFVTVFSVAASFLLSDISDRNHKRRVFLIVSVAGMGIGCILTGFSGDLFGFFIGLGIVKFFMAIYSPLGLALVVDNTKSLIDSMAGRELLLNVGRVSGGLLGLAVLVYSDIATALIVQGIAIFLYIAALEMKNGKIKM